MNFANILKIIRKSGKLRMLIQSGSSQTIISRLPWKSPALGRCSRLAEEPRVKLLSQLAKPKIVFSATGSPTQYRWQLAEFALLLNFMYSHCWQQNTGGKITMLTFSKFIAAAGDRMRNIFPGFVLLPDLEWDGWFLAKRSRPRNNGKCNALSKFHQVTIQF